MGLTDFISLVALYVEIGVLAYCDWKMWRTMYTPLNTLMLPYAFMLTVTLLFCGNFGVAEFYYPSLLVWMVGLVIFAIPSFVFGLLNFFYRKTNVNLLYFVLCAFGKMNSPSKRKNTNT